MIKIEKTLPRFYQLPSIIKINKLKKNKKPFLYKHLKNQQEEILYIIKKIEQGHWAIEEQPTIFEIIEQIFSGPKEILGKKYYSSIDSTIYHEFLNDKIIKRIGKDNLKITWKDILKLDFLIIPSYNPISTLIFPINFQTFYAINSINDLSQEFYDVDPLGYGVDEKEPSLIFESIATFLRLFSKNENFFHCLNSELTQIRYYQIDSLEILKDAMKFPIATKIKSRESRKKRKKQLNYEKRYINKTIKRIEQIQKNPDPDCQERVCELLDEIQQNLFYALSEKEVEASLRFPATIIDQYLITKEDLDEDKIAQISFDNLKDILDKKLLIKTIEEVLYNEKKFYEELGKATRIINPTYYAPLSLVLIDPNETDKKVIENIINIVERNSKLLKEIYSFEEEPEFEDKRKMEEKVMQRLLKIAKKLSKID